ncbi:hypothetical membrane protein [Gemmatimonas aurantiaca T-27]|uniref:Hypothetical membrane protein n=1 Tax=Gemmatimonas aurantiaca (strain DSM 14586 / JCM 11422 / NBRC 100505 / T-27) TaxID=379066 RepID=C1A8U6_GEMAT|nr:lysylphosphatidylglycerol synthase domain-containing protein [Gemmatimonas aurantiaca]BAH38656.1 hypothetical membrane protein [Gemmatimonas aurantiaca T-27]
MSTTDVMRWFRHPMVRLMLMTISFGYIGWAFAGQWQEMRTAARDLSIDWPWIGLGTVIVLATYAALIQSWRMLLAGWGGALSFPVAARIWTIANLGRWVPGKVWSVGALGVLAADAGVSGTAAAGAALLGTALNIGAGFAVVVISGAQGLDALGQGMSTAATALAWLFIAGVIALPWILPPLLDRLARWRGLPPVGRHISAVTLWTATAINLFSWVGYGIAFAAFARGVTPSVSSNPAVFVAVFSASYLIGYLVLFSPGGLGFREFALVALLVALGAAGRGDAVILSVTSRVWLTILEVLPGIVSLIALSPTQRTGLRRSG